MGRISIDTREGEQFFGRPKRASIERLRAFSGGSFSIAEWPKKNTHTDFDLAKARGLRTTIASGTQFEGYVCQLMVELFGIKWLSHAIMDVKFAGSVEAGDVVAARAVVKQKQDEPGATKFVLDVWVENERGEKVLVGTAAGMVDRT
jgi:acyl dehydratase